MVKLALLLTALLVGGPIDLQRWQSDIERWEPAIAGLEQLDRSQPDPDGAILFVGSSSIRIWNTLAEDMAPYPVIQRGYGGAKYSDLAFYAKRIILPHRFRALVLFVGNDVAGSEDDKRPEEVAAYFQYILDVVRKERPEVPIFCIDVRPMPIRWHVWPQVVAANRALREVCASDPNTHFVATSSRFLGPDGKPREELYRDDRLHLNRAGYSIWADLIKQALRKELDRRVPSE